MRTRVAAGSALGLIAAAAAGAAGAAALAPRAHAAGAPGHSVRRLQAALARHQLHGRGCRARGRGAGACPRTGRAPQTVWAAPGTPPLHDRQAAALVTRRPENRPANAPANDYVPRGAELSRFRSAANQYGQTPAQWNPLYRFVDGRDGMHKPSTDDLIQWTAHKWGIPEDWIRAALVTESRWWMSTLGDRAAVPGDWYRRYPPRGRVSGKSEVYESMGIAQVKWIPDGSVGAGTEPLRWKSTAFNLDYYAATVRYYFDGHCVWCTAGYGAGQRWNSIGAWYSPEPWANPDSGSYMRRVQGEVSRRAWMRPGF